MKKSLITMMAAAMMSTAFAGEATTEAITLTAPQDFKRLSGAVHVGVATAYTCHGYVPTTEVVQGEGMGMAALQAGYDFGKEGAWSYLGALSYKAPFSGHTLYGAPTKATINTPNGPVTIDHPMPRKNIENEFIFRNGLKYTREMWNSSVGYDFIHGGIAGVVAKHFDGQSQSRMQQFWWNGEITPVAWFSADVNVARTFDTVVGWWFEAHARFKAPIVGPKEDIKVAGILELGLSATSQFYTPDHNACDNGLQAYWVKLSTPWFVNEAKSFIITPSVSFNWLANGGRQANKQSEAKAYGASYVPFRDFAVVGDITATYRF